MSNFNLSYDDLYMNMAYLSAMKSKDQSTKIGAVVVDNDNTVRAIGFNSFPRGINDDLSERQEKPHKYFYFAHAERNSVYNSARTGVSLKDCRMYTPGFPCSGCAISIIQSGIKEVILCSEWSKKNSAKWSEEAAASKEMFDEAGVKVRYWTGSLLNITGHKSGETFRFQSLYGFMSS